MEFKLNIKMDNAAFDQHVEGELARILHKLAQDVNNMKSEYTIRDINGNIIGQAEIKGG